MNFHDISLPKFIAMFAVGRFEFTNSYVSTLSGREVMSFDRENSKQKYLFQLFKLYDDSISPYVRIITKPVKDSIKLYIGNEEIVVIINYDTGIITLNHPFPQEQTLVADFIFDVAVRFNNNSFEYSYCDDGSIELSPIELVEII